MDKETEKSLNLLLLRNRLFLVKVRQISSELDEINSKIQRVNLLGEDLDEFIVNAKSYLNESESQVETNRRIDQLTSAKRRLDFAEDCLDGFHGLLQHLERNDTPLNEAKFHIEGLFNEQIKNLLR